MQSWTGARKEAIDGVEEYLQHYRLYDGKERRDTNANRTQRKEREAKHTAAS